MVVGEAGLGKTTLLESFFQAFKDDEAAFALFERKETAREIETRRLLEEAQVRRPLLPPLLPHTQLPRGMCRDARLHRPRCQFSGSGAPL